MPDPPPIFFDLDARIVASDSFVHMPRQSAVQLELELELERIYDIPIDLAAVWIAIGCVFPFPSQPFERAQYLIVEHVARNRGANPVGDGSALVYVHKRDYGANITRLRRRKAETLSMLGGSSATVLRAKYNEALVLRFGGSPSCIGCRQFPLCHYRVGIGLGLADYNVGGGYRPRTITDAAHGPRSFVSQKFASASCGVAIASVT